MYAYTCCRCLNCAAQVVLEEQRGSNSGGRPSTNTK